VSTLVMARCCQLLGGGHIISLDHDARYLEKTIKSLQDRGLENYVIPVHAPLEEVKAGELKLQWYRFSELQPDWKIDTLFVDGPPTTLDEPLRRSIAGPILFPMLNSGGKVFLDDASRPGEKAVVEAWKKNNPDWQFDWLPLEKGCAVITRPEEINA